MLATIFRVEVLKRRRRQEETWFLETVGVSTFYQCTKHRITEDIKYKGVLFYITHIKNILQPTKSLNNIQSKQVLNSYLLQQWRAIQCHLQRILGQRNINPV